MKIQASLRSALALGSIALLATPLACVAATQPSTGVKPVSAGPSKVGSTTIVSRPISGLASRPNQSSATSDSLQLVAAARSQIGVTTQYDPAYVTLTYPGGDVDKSTGVCSDVVIRALRVLHIDLQQRIHEDMLAAFSAYPQRWGSKKPDSNIDHRRVGNIAVYFQRRHYQLPVTTNPTDYLPGDIVTFKIPLDHIGIVSDHRANDGFKIIHNIGAGTEESDDLFSWTITGHYRVLRS